MIFMPATKVGKIQAARVRRASNGSLIKSAKQPNTGRCIKYIKDDKGDKTLKKDLNLIENDIVAKTNGTQEYLINYAFNKHKCFDNETKTMLRTALNCSSIETAEKEFEEDENAYYRHKIESGNSKNINKAFHIINSFKGHSIPAAKVHAIGEEFARRLVGNSFKAVVSTHTNTDHYHNHIVINAYAADGAYKFKDSWNLGLKLQRIANELALENGIEIISSRMDANTFELEEDKLTFSQIRDKKMFEKGSFKRQIMSDIILSAKNSSNWTEYEEQMIKKGYEIKKNKKSLTYFNKNFGAIRDNRLGFQFTEPFINNYFDEKQELNEISNIKIKINYKNLYVPKYVGTGHNIVRIPVFLRLISYLIKLFNEILNAEPQIYRKNINFNRENIIKIKNQVKNLIKIEELLKKYNINNYSSLKIIKNQILKDYTVLNNTSKIIAEVRKKYEEIDVAIRKYNEYKSDIIEFGIKEEDLNLYDFGSADMLENRANLNPMTPKTKSRLYQALNNSGFVLKYKYNQISEAEAKEICYFLSSQKPKNQQSTTFVHPVHKNMPDTLYTLKEYLNLKKSNNLPIYTTTPKENRFKTLDYDALLNKYPTLKEEADKYTYGLKTEFNSYREALLKLRSYGFNTEEQMADFKENQIDTIIANDKNIAKKLIELKTSLNDLSKVETFYNGTYENIYKPIKMLSEHEIIQNDIKSFMKENESAIEQLICLKNTLNSLDLSILDDENLVMAPINILTTVQIILMIEGQDIIIENLIKKSKSELKNIIIDFINNYDLDKLIEKELTFEKQIFENQIDKHTTNEVKDVNISNKNDIDTSRDT